MSADLGYVLGVFIFLTGGVGLAGLSLLVIEGVYWSYCKITGRDY
jgi:hypothetical protein